MGIINPEYVKQYSQGCDIFVESGTWNGQSIEVIRRMNFFKEIHSIEINKSLYDSAVEKFKDDSTIKIWHGDSPDILREQILPIIKGRITFWLDGHGCAGCEGSEKYGSCPLLHELESIKSFGTKDHVIFADDQRMFDTNIWEMSREDYLDKLKSINENYKIDWLDSVDHNGTLCPKDVIVAHP